MDGKDFPLHSQSDSCICARCLQNEKEFGPLKSGNIIELKSPELDELPFQSFSSQVQQLLEKTAKDKGYNSTGTNGPNELYTFISNLNEGPGHALGEIIYKATRYKAKKDKSDLIKIAAWAYLIWRYDEDRKDEAIKA